MTMSWMGGKKKKEKRKKKKALLKDSSDAYVYKNEGGKKSM